MLSGLSSTPNLTPDQLLERFSTGSPRQRRSLIATIESRAEELAALGPSALAGFDPDGDDWAAGWLLQVFQRQQPQVLPALLGSSNGWFSAPSALGIDYSPLQRDLLAEQFEDADRFTSRALRQLAGPDAERRGYVYFSEVPSMQGLDLITLDRLWTAYSQGRFGFTAQARLLSALDGRYERLWPRIGWKQQGTWTRYPAAFTWSLTAPEGHMPLINQLRGVRLMDALLNHPALVARRETAPA
ncbi:MAG: GUN4 domain-containing protein [Synechococcus sp.]|nr:GUN4 domain-containing protein [Synechococcus sp.]